MNPTAAGCLREDAPVASANGTASSLWGDTRGCLPFSLPCPKPSDVTDPVRVTVHRTANWHVDVKVRPGARLAEIRAWRGDRWPDLQKKWHARMRWWIPWFTLNRQTVRAVEYASQRDDVYLTRDELRNKVIVALRWLREELRCQQLGEGSG